MVPGETSQIIPVQCVPADSEEKDFGFCIIRDMSSSQRATNKVVMTITRFTTSKEFVEQISWKFGYQPTSFELVFQRRKDKEAIVLDAESDQTLEELGFQYGDQSMCSNQLIITDKSGESCRKLEPSEVSSSDGLSNSNSTTMEGANCGRSKMFIFDAKRNRRKELKGYETPELAYVTPDSTTYDTQGTTSYAPRENSAYVPPPAPPPYASRSSEFLYNYNYNTLIKPETGLVGLVNQAMTCYLNSLLQTLYMTPEFRNAMYRWEFDGTEEEAVKSIPFQLQKLFLQLQTSKKSAVGTTELTTSFGWDSSEAWNQHDVQELCRVMFDALEQKFKNTEQSNLISTLYEGKLKDYVKCLQCGHESAREDTFLDVPLVVRPFGSSQAYGSVEEALHAFVTPEILEGSNQYFCEHCKKKCDAHKGLKFLKFPYLLTLQLKRFDFDPNTMHRIKLNDRVIFPEILNLNEFIQSENDQVLGENDANPVDTPVVGTQAPVTCGSFQEITTNERNLQKSMEKGPYVYELFSIMVHSGSANGGHYYAYIKSFKDGEWYCFNDAQVTKITYDDIQKTYGGGPTRGYYSSAYSSSMNAYMLMYRQINKTENADYSSEFPEHIKVLLKNMQDKEEKERQQKELDRFMCKIKLFCQHPVQKRMVEMRLKVHKNCTLAEATDTARKIMGLENIVPLDCCRLVKYDDFNDSLECSFDAAAESEPIGDLLGGVKSSYKFDLLLELKEPQDIFQEYRPGGTTVKMHIVDVERGEVAPSPITFRSYLTQTVSELKEQIAKLLKIDVAQIRLVLELFSNEMKLLDNPDKTLVSEGFAKSNKVFVEYQDPEDAKIPFKSSKFYEVLDCHSHTIIIHVALPKFDKLILEKLRIQEIEGDKEYVNSDDEEKENRPTTVQSGTMGRRVVRKAPLAPRTKKDIGGALYANTDLPNLVSSPVSPVSSNYGKTSSTNELAKKIQSSTTPDDPSQDCDEGLGDSEIVDAFYMNGCHSNQGVHSDQSEDSSLTDSERTLVGDELSPRNNSPDIMGTEMEIDAEPSQVAGLDSAKPESDSAHSSSDSNYQLDEQTEDYTNPSSPEENAIDSKYYRQAAFNDKKNICDSSCDVQSSTPYKHFRAYPYTDCETGEKMLRIYVDKRTTLAALKEALGPYVGVNSDCFKIYRLYSNNQEFECTRVAENLSSYTDDTRLTIKLGRALRKGEYKVKIYQLCINDSEPVKHLIDWVFVRGMTVLQAKQEILPEIKESCGLDIPLDRCRLRKKTWKNPGTVLIDQQRFEKEVHITPNWEVFLEILEEPEPVTSSSQITVFLRHWHPDTYVLDPFQEIVIEPNIDCLKSKISEISNIPVEFIEFAKAQGTFPCEISVLSIHNEIEWHFQKSTLKTWDLCVGDDGHVVYYRDCQVELKKLSEDEKRDILFKENAKTNKMQKASFSPKKEKALKIYTVDDVPNMYKSSSNGTSAGTENNKMLVPDLD